MCKSKPVKEAAAACIKKKRAKRSLQIREAKNMVSKMAQQVQALEYKPKNSSSISEMHKMTKRRILKVVTSKQVITGRHLYLQHIHNLTN